MADALEGFAADLFADVHLLAQRGDVLGQRFDQVGVVVDAHLEDRHQHMVAGGIGAVVHLQTLGRLGEGPELGVAHRDEHPLGDDERDRFDGEGLCIGHEEVRVADDRILGFGVFRRTLDLLDLLLGLEVDLHEVFDRLLLLDRRGEQVDPQNVVVTQFVEQLDVGVADDLVELLEVDGNHGFGSLRLYSAAPRRTRLPGGFRAVRGASFGGYRSPLRHPVRQICRETASAPQGASAGGGRGVVPPSELPV